MTPLLDFNTAATMLGKTPSGLRKLVERSRAASAGRPVSGDTIKYFQDGRGGAILFRPEWIEEYIDRNTVNPSCSEATKRKLHGKSRLDWSDLVKSRK